MPEYNPPGVSTLVSSTGGRAGSFFASSVLLQGAESVYKPPTLSPPPPPNPTPSIIFLSPDFVTVGGSGFTLTINGTDYLPTSSVTYNGISHAATYLGPTQLTIPLTSGDISSIGAYPVVVTNPSPGGGHSNPYDFVVQLSIGIVQYAYFQIPDTVTTSSTPQTPGTGEFTFTVNKTYTFVPGQQVFVYSRGSGSYMAGTVVSYIDPLISSTLIINVPAAAADLPYPVAQPDPPYSGSSQSDWNIVPETFTITLGQAPTDGNTIVFLAAGLYWNDPRRGMVLPFGGPFTQSTQYGGQGTGYSPSNPWAPAIQDNGFWGSGYYGAATAAMCATKPVSGDSATYTIGVVNTTPPLLGTIQVMFVEVYGAQQWNGVSPPRVQNGTNSPNSTPSFGPYTSYSTSDFRIAICCAGDGASIALTPVAPDSSYTNLKYETGGSDSALFAYSVEHATNGTGGFSVVFGDTPTFGGENTQTGLEAWLFQFTASH